jgi:hypothetical protein
VILVAFVMHDSQLGALHDCAWCQGYCGFREMDVELVGGRGQGEMLG